MCLKYTVHILLFMAPVIPPGLHMMGTFHTQVSLSGMQKGQSGILSGDRDVVEGRKGVEDDSCSPYIPPFTFRDSQKMIIQFPH